MSLFACINKSHQCIQIHRLWFCEWWERIRMHGHQWIWPTNKVERHRFLSVIGLERVNIWWIIDKSLTESGLWVRSTDPGAGLRFWTVFFCGFIFCIFHGQKISKSPNPRPIELLAKTKRLSLLHIYTRYEHWDYRNIQETNKKKAQNRRSVIFCYTR